jgi:DNA-directed RNA polymerase subunit beta
LSIDDNKSDWKIEFCLYKKYSAYPDFLDVQEIFSRFFQLETKSDERGNEGLYNTFMENFPITDTRNNFVLEFLDYFVDPRYNSRMYRKRSYS